MTSSNEFRKSVQYEFNTNEQNENQSNYWVKLSECDEFIGPKRSKHTMVTYGNSLYVFGGDNGKHMINDLITYDFSNKSWGRALNSSPPIPRYHHTAVIYNSSMFVFGGYTGDLNSNSNLCNKNDLYEYKFGNGTWHLWNVENPAPSPRTAHGAVVYEDKLWIFAGYGNHRLNDMWYIQLNSQQNRCWKEVEQKGDQPPTVCNFTIGVIQDAMYLFSGQSGTKTSNTLFKFDFKSYNWSKVVSNHILRSTCPPPERRSGHVMVTHGNCLYIYGGVLGNNFFHDLYSFDLETKIWTLIPMSSLAPVPSARSFMAASVFDGSLHIFGGNVDQNSRSNELYRFKLLTQPKCTLREDFYKLLQKELLCDLNFIINDVKIKAHCAIVACRSAYLKQRIKNIMESLQFHYTPNQQQQQQCFNNININFDIKQFYFLNNEKKIIDIKINETNNPNAFKIVLEFIYTDCIVSIEGKEQEIESLKLMADVYKLADQFQIGKLVNVSESFFESIISCANVLSILEYVDKLNLTYLKELCMKYLTKESNFKLIVMSNEFEHLEQTLMVEIVRRQQSSLKSTLNIIEQSYLNETTSIQQHDKYKSLEQDFELFFRNGQGNEFSDILIHLNDNNNNKYFFAHKCILAARCAYFEAYFRSFTPKNNQINLTIGDTTPPYETALALLKYIYYDSTNMSTQDALYLFSASHYFQFTNSRLQVFCKRNLETNVSKDNVFDIFQAADKIQADDMKNFTLKIIRKDFASLAQSENIRKLSKELLLDIIIDISKVYPTTNLTTTVAATTGTGTITTSTVLHNTNINLLTTNSTANSYSQTSHSNSSSPNLSATNNHHNNNNNNNLIFNITPSITNNKND